MKYKLLSYLLLSWRPQLNSSVHYAPYNSIFSLLYYKKIFQVIWEGSLYELFEAHLIYTDSVYSRGYIRISLVSKRYICLFFVCAIEGAPVRGLIYKMSMHTVRNKKPANKFWKMNPN